jgi:hypothetical protein
MSAALTSVHGRYSHSLQFLPQEDIFLDQPVICLFEPGIPHLRQFMAPCGFSFAVSPSGGHPSSRKEPGMPHGACPSVRLEKRWLVSAPLVAVLPSGDKVRICTTVSTTAVRQLSERGATPTPSPYCARGPEDRIDAALVAGSLRLKPLRHIAVEAKRQARLGYGHPPLCFCPQRFVCG